MPTRATVARTHAPDGGAGESDVERPAGAPARDEARDTILRDGSSITVRDAEVADEPALLAFLEGLEDETKRLRFATLRPNLPDRAHRWAVLERAGDVSLVAETGGGPDGAAGTIIGNASADRLGPDSAEVAFVVAEAYQGLGVATLLLEELARRASAVGITTFHAEVLPENAKMLEVFRATGFPLRVHADIGELRVEFPTALTGEARARFERTGAARRGCSSAHAPAPALRGGHRCVASARDGRWRAVPQPARRRASPAPSTRSTRAPTSCSPWRPTAPSLDIPGTVDLAVVAVPAADVVRRRARVRGAGRQERHRRVARLRRGRPRGRCPPARPGRSLSRRGHAPGRPEQPGGYQPRPRGPCSTPPSARARRHPAASACSRRAARWALR